MREVIVITGSSGLIGSRTARRLAPDHDVVGLDTKPPSSAGVLREHVPVDLTRQESVEAALGQVRRTCGERIASVLHLAAYYDFSGEPSPLYEEVTVNGTSRLLEGLARQGLRVEQFLFSSSMLVHAPCAKGERIDESSPLLPRWDYPRSKVDTEQLLRARHGALPLAILRIAGVYDDRCHSIPIAHQLQRLFERQLTSRFFPGDLSHGQAFVHLEDLVDAFAALVERRASLPSELTLLIGEPETASYDELQRRLGALLHGEEVRTHRIPKTLAKAGAWVQDHLPGRTAFIKPWMIDLADDHYELDVSRARALLGWEARRRLLGTLPQMVEALQADPPGFYRENKLQPPRWLERALVRPRERAPAR